MNLGKYSTIRRSSPDCARQKSGAALVTTVIVVAVLAVVAVAFLQSNTADLSGSRSVINHLRAQMAAEAGASAAQHLVMDLIRRYPDSVTVWQNVGGGAMNGTNNEATVLYVRAKSSDTNAGASPAEFGDAITILARPLVSLTNYAALFPLTGIASSVPVSPSTTVNLNATNSSFPHPFIGLRTSTNAGAPITAAQWIYLTNAQGMTNARYAFWVEDESFKVNINVATNGLRAASSMGLGPEEIRIDGAWISSTNATLTNANASAAINSRSTFGGGGYPTIRSASFPSLSNTANLTNTAELHFLTTTHSAGLDLSRGGFKRFNINSVTNGIAGPTDANNIRTNLNRLIAVITNSNSVPNFGQRFYRLATNAATGTNPANINALAVTPEHANIYLQKIAANIMDYIDNDDQPTVLNNIAGFTIRAGRPEFGIEPLGGGTDGSNSVAALGVENTPRLQEYVIHGRLRELSPVGFNTNSAPADPVANYRITIDHYFEFWNPGSRDITLSGAFLKVYDQPRYGTNINGVLASEGRPFELSLPDITFPAGRVIILTTAPAAEINTNLITVANMTNVISVTSPDESHREFTGQTRDTNASGSPYGGNGLNRYFHVTMRARTTSTTDYESGVILGNESGLLESFGALPIVAQTGPGVSALHFIANTQETFDAMGDGPAASNVRNVRGGSLAGNSSITNNPSWAMGDPRSLNEQLDFFVHTSGTDAASQLSRFLHTGLANGSVPANSSVGAPNTNYVDAARWVDVSSLLAGANNAPLFVRNDSMQSVGEFGHLTDPARVPGPPAAGVLSNVVYSRGGGRTLRIGQSEHPWWFDGNQTNASRTWTSWRLADVFTTKTNATISGLINPNGVLRDNGAAILAALHGVRMLPSPEGSPNTADQSVNVINVVTNALARMTNLTGTGLPAGAVNPFWERGEISELPIFNTGSTLAGVNMSQAFDRGREEVVRRSIEMITTRGSVFTVYAMGQVLQGTNVTSTTRLKQTFQIEPQFAGGVNAFNDSFAPSIPQQLQERFATPTNYTSRILQTSYD